jgi:hypothetical protein
MLPLLRSCTIPAAAAEWLATVTPAGAGMTTAGVGSMTTGAGDGDGAGEATVGTAAVTALPETLLDPAPPPQPPSGAAAIQAATQAIKVCSFEIVVLVVVVTRVSVRRRVADRRRPQNACPRCER